MPNTERPQGKCEDEGTILVPIKVECRVIKVVTRADGRVERYESNEDGSELVIDQEACATFLLKELAEDQREHFEDQSNGSCIS